MATIIVRQVPNEAAIAVLLKGPTGAVVKELYRRGLRVEAAAKRKCPVDMGFLRASIGTSIDYVGAVPVCSVGSELKYAIWVHEGTGIYGPTGSRIYPKNGRFLVWDARGKGNVKVGGSGKIFARSVAGIKGTPFLRDALSAGVSGRAT